jgi:hypothetical protein
MIENEQQLRQTPEALRDLETSLAALNRQKSAIHPDRYMLMAEPVVEHIRRLRAEIDSFIGMTDVAVGAVPQAESSK